METVILKIILCSSLLIAIYYLFLQKEIMFRFNRFYLLFALVFSYAIPFVKINLPAISQQKNQLIFEEISTQQLIQKTSKASEVDWMILILIIYIFVSIILIFRSLISIIKITSLKGVDFNYKGQKVKLIEKDMPPFSFWNKIYLSQKHFKDKIDHRIFLHEKEHLVQKHSLDLILIEILKTVSWFNPAIYFYRKAITDNHEFLADEVIINKEFNIKDYQNLILSEVLNAQNLSLINQFNFNNTKKRFIMMTTKRSKSEKFKKLFAVSAFAGLSILFVQKVYASENQPEVKSGIPEVAKNETLKLDTIPSKKTIQTNVKIKDKKKVPPPPPPRVMKENELPIPPPPPPARDITPAEFPEGLNALRTSFSNIFDSSSLTGKGTIKSIMYISIDENGKTIDVKAEGENSNFNKEAIRAMKSVTENKTWKPATEEGKPAATVFQLPLTMNFK
jgi:bla regulator protein BlaR1